MTSNIFVLPNKVKTLNSSLKQTKNVKDANGKSANTLPAGTVLTITGFKGTHNNDYFKASFIDPFGESKTAFFQWSNVFSTEESKQQAAEMLERIRRVNGNQLPKYLHGGLVDFTGPAWVDGTKKKPEAFLSAKDTELLKSKVFSDSDYSLRSVVELF